MGKGRASVQGSGHTSVKSNLNPESLFSSAENFNFANDKSDNPNN